VREDKRGISEWHRVFKDEARFPRNEDQYVFRGLPLQPVWGKPDTFEFWHLYFQEFLHHYKRQ